VLYPALTHAHREFIIWLARAIPIAHLITLSARASTFGGIAQPF